MGGEGIEHIADDLDWFSQYHSSLIPHHQSGPQRRRKKKKRTTHLDGDREMWAVTKLTFLA